MPEVNWTTDSIWRARDRFVRFANERRCKVKLYSDGWAVGPAAQGMDIFTACRLLNDHRATLEESE